MTGKHAKKLCINKPQKKTPDAAPGVVLFIICTELFFNLEGIQSRKISIIT